MTAELKRLETERHCKPYHASVPFEAVSLLCSEHSASRRDWKRDPLLVPVDSTHLRTSQDTGLLAAMPRSHFGVNLAADIAVERATVMAASARSICNDVHFSGRQPKGCRGGIPLEATAQHSPYKRAWALARV